MKRCFDCGTQVDEKAVFCPQCGKNMAMAGQDPMTVTGRIDALISSANKKQQEGKWDEAIADAAEALRLNPDKADTATLIAGIYEQRGMFDEAAIWYRTAMQLNPESVTDQVLLEHVLERRTKKTKPIKANNLPIIVSAAVGLIVMLLLFAITIRNKNLVSAPNKSGGNALTSPISPLFPGTGENNTQPQPPVNNQPQIPNTASIPVAKTAGEVEVKNRIASSEYMSNTGMNVDDVSIDPDGPTATVTISVAYSPGLTKDWIVWSSAMAAFAAFESHKDINSCTVRCIQSGTEGGNQLVFVGDMSKESANNIPEKYNMEQLYSAFGRIRWRE